MKSRLAAMAGEQEKPIPRLFNEVEGQSRAITSVEAPLIVRAPIRIRFVSTEEVPHHLFRPLEDKNLDVRDDYGKDGRVAMKRVDMPCREWVSKFNKQEMGAQSARGSQPWTQKEICAKVQPFLWLYKDRADALEAAVGMHAKDANRNFKVVIIPGRKMAEMGAEFVALENAGAKFENKLYLWQYLPAHFFVDIEIFDALKSKQTEDIVDHERVLDAAVLDEDTIIVDTNGTPYLGAPERGKVEGTSENFLRNNALPSTPTNSHQSQEPTQAVMQARNSSSSLVNTTERPNTEVVMQEAQKSPSSSEDSGEVRDKPGPWQAQAHEWNDKYYPIEKILSHKPKYAARKYVLSYEVLWKGDYQPSEQKSFSERVGKAAVDAYWNRVEEENAAKRKGRIRAKKEEEEDSDYMEE